MNPKKRISFIHLVFLCHINRQLPVAHIYTIPLLEFYEYKNSTKISNLTMGLLLGMELRGTTKKDMKQKQTPSLTEKVLKRALIPFSPTKDKSTELSKGILVIRK